MNTTKQEEKKVFELEAYISSSEFLLERKREKIKKQQETIENLQNELNLYKRVEKARNKQIMVLLKEANKFTIAQVMNNSKV